MSDAVVIALLDELIPFLSDAEGPLGNNLLKCIEQFESTEDINANPKHLYANTHSIDYLVKIKLMGSRVG
ncbi:hypothetical protein LCGC14_1466650 [marine sediment metagenome]|uniref:Uncharacterized protein n=1 Tax=marine sediment metagenome TaxID=412755 RepID=A0A0F9LU89_9ZZZZ